MAEPVVTEETPIKTTTTPVSTNEEGQVCYPTLQMLLMMQKLDALTKEGATQEEKDAFRREYVVKTGLKRRESLIMIASIFVYHLYMEREDMTFQEKLQSLVALEAKLDEKIEHIGFFYCRMMDRVIAKETVFYAMTVDEEENEPFDLLETAQTARYITTKECNTCHKKNLTLLECRMCHSAAYCSKECQKVNWPFHKQFCPFLKDGKILMTCPEPSASTQTNV